MRRGLLLAAGSALTVSLAGAALADVMPPDDSDPRALELLTAAAHSGRNTSYEGTQVVMLWLGERQLSASIRIAHRAGAGSVIRLEQTASSPERTVFEPAGQGSGALAGPTAEALTLVRRNYVVSLDGTDDVIGRHVDIILVHTRAGRAVQRLWIDRTSALPLRRAFYDDSGRLVRQTAFVSLSARTPEFSTVQLATVPARASTGTVDVGGLRAAGWQVPPAPDGMVAYDAVVSGSGQDAVLHVAYTDGIETMSLFAQRGHLESSALRGWRRTTIAGRRARVSGGYPRRVVWSNDGHVYTVVTACDERAVEHMVRSLTRGEHSDGLSPRVRRGVHRVASWINPTR